MRILLINPSVNPKKFGRYYKLIMEPMPCIGLAYIGAVLEKNRHVVKIIDNFVMNYSIDRIIEEINQFSPDVVGISVLTPTVNFSLKLSTEIKKYNSKIIMVAGNVHPTQFPEEFLKPKKFDIVVSGEGEETMVELVNAIEQQKNLNNIKGISYHINGRIFRNESRPIIKDLDSLPFPAWHLLPYKKYGLTPLASIKKPMLTVLASRGCPFTCKYCSLSYMDRTYRKRSAKLVADEIEYLIKRFRINQFCFIDPIFPLGEEYTIEVCDELIKRNINRQVVWVAETKIDLLNEKLIKKLKDAGCGRLIFGLETGSQETLDKIGKKINSEKTKTNMKLLRKHNIETIGLFMIGLPGETEKSIIDTINFSISLNLDFAKFSMLVPFPGSEFYEILKNRNKIRTENWDDYTGFNPTPENLPYVPDNMAAERLISLQRLATIKFYIRPKMIFKQLFKIRTIKPEIILKGLYSILP